MKHYKLFKLRAVLLLFAFLCSMPNVWADESGTVGDIQWSYVEATKTLTLNGEGEVPDLWNYISFRDALNDRSKIQNVVILEGITSIGDYAFYGMSQLSSVIIPDGIEEIGNSAFRNCTSLTSIVIPNSVDKINTSVFENCTSLVSITLSKYLTFLDSYAFKGCSNLTTISIPSNVNFCPNGVFLGCTGMTDIYIYADPNEILDAYSMFISGFKENKETKCHVYNKAVWENIVMQPNVTFVEDLIEPQDGEQYIYGESGPKWSYDKTTKTLTISGEGDMHSFAVNEETPWMGRDISNIVVGEGITSIGDYSFKNIRAENVTINSTSLTSIGTRAFAYCLQLTSVNVPEGVETIGNSAFRGNRRITTFTLPSTLTSIESKAFINTGFAEDVYCYANPENLTWADNNEGFRILKWTKFHVTDKSAWEAAFPDANVTFVGDLGKHYISGDSGPIWEYNADTKTLTISGEGEVTKPSDLPWVNCDVEHIVIEQGITSIGSMLFNGLPGLKSVTMANTVTKIGSYAFENCQTLVTVSFSDNIEEIEEFAFKDCYGITTITLPSMLTTIGNAAFHSCYQLTNLTIPDKVTSIGASAFYNCGITSINIPASVNDIGLNPFASCINLVDITVASTNTKYDSHNDCKAIIETSSNTLISGCKTTTIPEGIEIIDATAFQGMTGLTSITIPSGVKSIEYAAFSGCENLQSIVLPNSVQHLDLAAFQQCYSLSTVTLSTNVDWIEDAAFGSCTSLTTFTIPSSVTHFTYRAFSGCNAMTDVYCSMDPNDDNNTIVFNDELSHAFKENKETKFHVFNKSTWETKFPNANVTFVGDLASSLNVDEEAIGTSGVKWRYTSEDKTLTIYGSGAMPDYSDSEKPGWYYKDIDHIVVEFGIRKIGSRAFEYSNVTTANTYSSGSIGEKAFHGCTQLTTINVSADIRYIYASAFSGCSSLSSVTIYAPQMYNNGYGTNAFSGNADGRKIYVFNNYIDIYKQGWSDYADDIEPITLASFHADPQKPSDKWRTYYNAIGVNVEVPEGTSVYTAGINDNIDKVILTEVGDRIIPAWNAVILKSSETSIPLSNPSKASAYTTEFNQNLLTSGSTDDYIKYYGNDALDKIYTLSAKNGKMGFYKFNGILDPDKAHLYIDGSPVATAPEYLGFDFGSQNGTTSIELPATPILPQADQWYTLDGRRLQAKPSYKGIYLNNGRKIVVK